ncbi:MAG TPA: hypothetical protein EYH30_03835 [Anaerolineales bacterium]|nr:hypothetical protein [Anaerolineales bacterium]
MSDRWLVRIAAFLALSVVVTGGLAVYLTLERRGEREIAAPEEAAREPRIAFVSDREGEPAVYVIDPDGTSLQRVSEVGWLAFFPAWSPDGRRVAYVGWRSEDEEAGVCVAAADGADRIQVSGTVTGVTGLSPTWSPDGTRLAFVSIGDPAQTDRPDSVIHVAWADGDGLERSIPLLEFVITGIEWSPTGDELLLVAAPAGGESGVYRLPTDGGEMTEVLTRTNAADWSPDGEAVAAAAYSTHTLYIVRGDERMEEVAQVTGNPEEVVWSPDGAHIALATAYGRDQDFAQALFVVDVETGEMTTVVEGEGWLIWPNWSPDGQQLLFTMGPMRRRSDSDLPYADLWVYDLASGRLEQLTFEEGFEGLGVWGP